MKKSGRTPAQIKQDRIEKIKSFDVNDLGKREMQIYGLPFDPEEAEIALVPVPWEVTVSYAAGTAKGPEQILEASFQVDLCSLEDKNFWQAGIYMEKTDAKLVQLNKKLREKAETYIDSLEKGAVVNKEKKLQKTQSEIEEGCQYMNNWVKQTTQKCMAEGKVVGLVGGDHSTPLGFLQALAEQHSAFGILQVDAHADLRQAYEGFKYSHASIMYNALEIPQVKKLVQVGIRDFCQFEVELIEKNKNRVNTYFDYHLKQNDFNGINWNKQCKTIVSQLPQKVYISFDIDGLEPSLCPNTGTPVAGGLTYAQALYLMEQVVLSGRQIIGFDLVEVANGETDWDANVAARLLYNMARQARASQQRKAQPTKAPKRSNKK